MRVIIAEKITVAKTIAPIAAERWPGEEIMIMVSMPYMLNKYAYPRGLAYGDYPLIGNPSYKKTDVRFEDGTFARGIRVTNGRFISSFGIAFKPACNLMQTVKHLVFAGDWDHTGVWGMERMLELLAPERDKTDYDVAVLNGGLDEASIRRVLKDLRRPEDPRFVALSNAAQVKRYFDYNFNVNSLPIMGNLYRSIAGSDQPVLFTKYMIQVLLFVIKHGDQGAPNNSDWLRDWKGTGKYAFVDNEWSMGGLGSAASRAQILRNLHELGLVEPAVVESRAHCFGYRCTPMGLVFAGRLHKDCADPDLPFRLEDWMGKPFAEVKSVIDTYILTFFRRQKRHQGI
jgi:hypothetical protein